jgi:hypothetical protein
MRQHRLAAITTTIIITTTAEKKISKRKREEHEHFYNVYNTCIRQQGDRLVIILNDMTDIICTAAVDSFFAAVKN